ncbi:septum formation family protein [Nocardioides speluncae]|uniref:septum formation family protein n=1 Tax=Nocardioides speluncae TaxID=2670337 RepID=UPI000D68780D|nr:septum formation family protein [Nocardioides speluncae]
MTDPHTSPSAGQEPAAPGSMTAGLPAYDARQPGPGSPYPQGPHWAPPHQRPPSKTMAGWALGLSFVPAGITLLLAAIFAFIVLGRSKDGRDHGKGMAIGALCMVAVWIVAIVGLIALAVTTDADRNSSGAIEEEGRLNAQALRAGDCFQLPDGEEVFTVDAIPCAESHQAEVYAVIELAEGEFPGNEQVTNQADQRCAKRFKAFVGTAYGDSDLEIFLLTPTKRSWQLDDRAITCAVTMPGNQSTTGSLRNAGR